MIEPSDEPDDLDLRLPRRLVADLRAAEPVPVVRPGLDADILGAARRVMIWRRHLRKIQIVIGTGALAAAIGLVVMLRVSTVQRAAAVDPRDLNADGRVDILDAFTLARRLEAAESLPAWDFNHDGRIDRRDVDTIASDAVKLSNLSVSFMTPPGSGAELRGVAQASRLCGIRRTPGSHTRRAAGGAS